ncbi:hypothetical protein EUX98_g4958 [Antrodiella citrinella]|uniref:Uncharacterized protein n=1 Tax=Antrodiella citrinella TaxID=2447956 RepID=A0A4S4MSQ0_9APHY|nr:hypothetical protein EUX98_g4958 [Antrodiella citrinella]
MSTISASEPLLAEAVAAVMGYGRLLEVSTALLYHIDHSYVDPGRRGEVLASLIITEARDAAVKASTPISLLTNTIPPDQFRSDGFLEGRVVRVPEFFDALLAWKDVRKAVPACFRCLDEKGIPLESAFAEAFIYFNHFLNVEDYEVINQEHLWCIMTRGAAVVCPNDCQCGVDLPIPVLMDVHLKKENMTAIFVHVGIHVHSGTSAPAVRCDVSIRSRSIFQACYPTPRGAPCVCVGI